MAVAQLPSQLTDLARTGTSCRPADNLTEWEREKEKEEFVKIANDFKKVPDVMASRFQSAGKLGTRLLVRCHCALAYVLRGRVL
jgi:hypothetical protein